MAQPQVNIQIEAPGFMGLNTQDSPIGLPPTWASQAEHCVIDSYGRIASRKGIQARTQGPEDAGNMGSVNPTETAYEFVKANGTRTLLLAGDDHVNAPQLWSQDVDGLLNIVTGRSGWTANNWQFTSLSDKCYMAQLGHNIQETNGTTVAALAEQPNSAAAIAVFGANSVLSQPNCILAAFGRLFIANTATNKSTVQWSVLTTNSGLGATPWSGAGAGLINVEEYWPNGSDEITALAAHNDFLIIFGRRSILIYAVPMGVQAGNTGPEYMTLEDTIENIGCIARDSVVSIGTDIAFLDASGLRSLARTVQEKSVPVGDLSKNVRDDLIRHIRDNGIGEIRSCFSPDESTYFLLLPNSAESSATTYVFDTRRPLEDGSLRVTRWPGKNLYCAVRTDAGELLFGRKGGLYVYTGGNDTSVLMTEDAISGVPMNYWTHHQNFDKPVNLKFPKQIDLIMIGGSLVTILVQWSFDFSDSVSSQQVIRDGDVGGIFGVGIFGPDPLEADFGTTGGLISLEHVNLWGSGRNIRVGFSGTIFDTQLSIQEMNLQALLGRIL